MDERAKATIDKLRALGGELAVQVFATIVSDVVIRLDEVLKAEDRQQAFQDVLAESLLSTVAGRPDVDAQMRETILRHLPPSEVMDAVRRLRPDAGM